MKFNVLFCILAVLYFSTTAVAQTISGRIIDEDSNPIADADVSLVVRKISVKSDSTGAFSINTSITINQYCITNHQPALYISGQKIHFSNVFPEQVQVEYYTVNGKNVRPVLNLLFPEGSFALPVTSLMKRNVARGLYILRISKGSELFTFPVHYSDNCTSVLKSTNACKHALAKRFATADTLIVSKQHYAPVSRVLDSDVTQDVGDIQLIMYPFRDMTQQCSLQEFETIKSFILDQGDRQAYSAMYNNNPHYSFEGFEAYLNPETGQKNINCDPDVSDFNQMVLIDQGGSPTCQLQIVREGDLQNADIFIPDTEHMREGRVYLLENNEDLDVIEIKANDCLAIMKDTANNS